MAHHFVKRELLITEKLDVAHLFLDAGEQAEQRIFSNEESLDLSESRKIYEYQIPDVQTNKEYKIEVRASVCAFVA